MQVEVGSADGRRLVLDVGVGGPPDGETVLLLHGFPQSAHCWRHVAPALAAAGYRTVAPDQRGYSPGARPAGAAAYVLPELVSDALAVLDALGAERGHVVGHDWGAAVAWQLAARSPDRVRTLTAVSVPHPAAFRAALAGDADQQRRSRYLQVFQGADAEQRLLGPDREGREAGWFRSFFSGAEDVVDVDRHLAEMREPGRLTGALNWYRAPGRAFASPLPPVTVPTLYVWSDGDLALGRTAAEATGRHVAGPYRFAPLAGVTHWVPDQAPERLSALLLEHLPAKGTSALH